MQFNSTHLLKLAVDVVVVVVVVIVVVVVVVVLPVVHNQSRDLLGVVNGLHRTVDALKSAAQAAEETRQAQKKRVFRLRALADQRRQNHRSTLDTVEKLLSADADRTGDKASLGDCVVKFLPVWVPEL